MPIGSLAAAASIAGALINRSSARKGQKLAQGQFDDQMDQSIQRRVADAKKAGIHPLYAIGASPSASPTISMSGQAYSGSHLGDAVADAGRHIATGIENKQAKKVQAAHAVEMQKNYEAQRFRDRAAGIRDLAAAQATESAAKTSAAVANSNRVQPNVSDIPEPRVHDPGYKGSVLTPSGRLQQRQKRTPAGEVAERYGGVSEELFGLWYLTQDIGSKLGLELHDYLRRPTRKGKPGDDNVAP